MKKIHKANLDLNVKIGGCSENSYIFCEWLKVKGIGSNGRAMYARENF